MDPAPGFRCQANGLAEAPREMALAEIAALRDHGYRRIGTQTCKSKGDARIDPADGQQAGLQSSLQEREAARRRRQLCQALPQALDGCPAPDILQRPMGAGENAGGCAEDEACRARAQQRADAGAGGGAVFQVGRSEERRVGKASGSTGRSRWLAYT